MKAIIFLASIFLFKNSYSQNTIDDENGEVYIFHINDYPHARKAFWGNDDWAANGIANDSSNWFIASIARDWVGSTGDDWILFKIPVNIDLNNEQKPSAVKAINSKSYGSSDSLHGYGHIGDVDYVENGDDGYVVAPIYSNNDKNTRVAFFNSSSLKYESYATIPFHAGWCAAKKEGEETYLYTSKHHAYYIYKYRIEWDKALDNDGSGLVFNEKIRIDSTKYPEGIRNMQGGDFSPSGELLYISSGLFDCDPAEAGGFWGGIFGGILGTVFGGIGGLGAIFGSIAGYIAGDVTANEVYAYEDDGIHIFKLKNNEYDLVSHSVNSKRSNLHSCFNFSYDNFECSDLEPEGLTIWDLNDNRSENVSGQLHVLLDDHDPPGGKINLHHYKSFECPSDIDIVGSSAAGEPASNSEIKDFLTVGIPMGTIALQSNFGCGFILNDAPSFFDPGSTKVEFTLISIGPQNISCNSTVNVINEHDECSTALRLYPCDRTLTNNYCASPSVSLPSIQGYNGDIKDVWFKIYPTKNFSVETYQVDGGLTNTVMQLFKGTCSNLTEVASDDTSGDGNHSKITISNYSGTQPLYLRVTDFNANNFEEFGIYLKKIDPGSDLFNPTSYVDGDPEYMQKRRLKGDFNGDGKMDIAFAYESATTDGLTIATKISDGNGSFDEYTDFIGDKDVFEYSTKTGDVNEDGKTDIIFILQTSDGLTIKTLLASNNLPGQFNSVEDVLHDGAGVHEYPTLSGDADGDGDSDLFFIFNSSNDGLTVRTKLSDGTGKYIERQAILGDSEGVHEYPTKAGDVNGDGKTDLVFIYNTQSNGLTVRTKMSNGDGSFESYFDKLGDGEKVHEYPTQTGDVNGDGMMDLIFIGQDWSGPGLNIRTKMSNGDGTFEEYSDVLGDGAGVHTYPTLTGDVNGDGKTDLIFVGQNWRACGLNIRVKLSNGDGSWCSDFQSMSDGDGVHEGWTTMGDFNGDGKSDILFAFQHWDGSELNIRTKFSEIAGCNGLSSNEAGDVSQYLIYPNPTTTYLNIGADDEMQIAVRIIGQTGNVVRNIDNMSSSDQINVSTLHPGIYFVEINNLGTGEKVVNLLAKID